MLAYRLRRTSRAPLVQKPNQITWGKGAKYHASETLLAASFATRGDVAFFTLFERDDICHARLWTSGDRSILWNRVRPGRSHFKCHCGRNRQPNQTSTYGYDQCSGSLQLSASCCRHL